MEKNKKIITHTILVKAYLVLLILTIMSCAKEANYAKIIGAPTSDYNYIFAKFNNDLNRLGYRSIDFTYTKILSFQQGEIDSAFAVGACNNTQKGESRPVNISVRNDLLPNDNKTNFVLYHEIGHCLFGLKHSYSGIMTEFITSGQFDNFENEFYRLQLVEEMIAGSDLLK